MAYSIISSEKTNTGTLYHFTGTSSDTKPTGKWVGENSEFKELDTGDTYFFDNPTAGWVKKAGESGGSGGSGGGLPADFPTEDILNADKFIGFDENGDYAALDAPSGAEKFVVTLTQDAQTEEWTADKTVAEIVEAYANDEVVVAKTTYQGADFELPISADREDDSNHTVCFSAIINFGGGLANITFVGQEKSEDPDEWAFDATGVKGVPSFSSSNNGQVLGVDDGDLAWVSSGAPVYFDFTVTESGGQYTATPASGVTGAAIKAAVDSGVPAYARANLGFIGTVLLPFNFHDDNSYSANGDIVYSTNPSTVIAHARIKVTLNEGQEDAYDCIVQPLANAT